MYDVLRTESGSIDIHTMRPVSPGMNVGSATPDISYPAGAITQVAIHCTRRYEGGASYWEDRVVIHARMDRPDRVIQTFSFDTGAEAEGFYGDVLRILGWT